MLTSMARIGTDPSGNGRRPFPARIPPLPPGGRGAGVRAVGRRPCPAPIPPLPPGGRGAGVRAVGRRPFPARIPPLPPGGRGAGVRAVGRRPCPAPIPSLPQDGRGVRARAGLRAQALLGALLVSMTGVACALSLQTIEPRAFGYTVGDVLQRRVVLDPNRDGTLDPASLPHPGRSGRWFQLREVASAPDAVTLVYQIVNTPEQPDRE